MSEGVSKCISVFGKGGGREGGITYIHIHMNVQVQHTGMEDYDSDLPLP